MRWNDGTILRTEPFYDYDNGIKEWSSKFSYENKGKFEWIDYKKFEKPKQETLEEFAERSSKYTNHSNINIQKQEAIILGAKWQEKRMYSEEEVLNFTQTTIMQYKFGNTNIEQMDLLKETLQQYKNKQHED